MGKIKKYFFNRGDLAVYICAFFIVVVFLAQQLGPMINLNITKVDDWQYTSDAGLGSVSTFSDLLLLLTPLKILAAVSFVVLFALLPLSSWYIFYRFFGFLIRRFKPDLRFGTKEQVNRSLVHFVIGLVAAGFSVYLIYNFNWYFIPVGGAAVLVIGGMMLSGLVTLVYIPFATLVFIVQRLRKKLSSGLGRKLLKAISINLASGGLVLLFAIPQVIIMFFGVNITSIQLPAVGGGGYRGGQISLAPGSSFSALKSPSLMEFGSLAGDGNIGFSTGGAKDINNFRVNIQNNYLPLVTDVTYEGLFYDYYFDTGQMYPCSELFCPSYSYAISRDPLSSEKEYYLSVDLNSGIKQSDFQRKRLNLVIVMDISGSMGSPFNRYYYDQFGNQKELGESKISNESKMKVANKSVVALLEHLKSDDKFGMVLFDNRGYVAKPMREVGATDMGSLKRHILEIVDRGGTNMESGYSEATKLLKEFEDADKTVYENRIIFLTDAQPNIGVLDEKGLLGMTKSNSDGNIYTSFIGIGVDFNTELIEHITKIKGANYYSVHTAEDFSRRMDEGFEYMVTPLVFDLVLEVNSGDFEIEKVYGSPEADLATGEIMRVNTLFPSERKEEEVKGGIVLLKLRKLSGSGSPTLELTASYTDRSSQYSSNNAIVTILDVDNDVYQNDGIRKAIVLSRYANFLKVWISDERDSKQVNKVVEQPSITTETGILIPEQIILSKWERTSVPLAVSEPYKEAMRVLKQYLENEKQVLGDETLDEEVKILNKLISS